MRLPIAAQVVVVWAVIIKVAGSMIAVANRAQSQEPRSARSR
jgi:hypothetical protein